MLVSIKMPELQELIEIGEGYHIEYKESADKSFARVRCAFPMLMSENF